MYEYPMRVAEQLRGFFDKRPGCPSCGVGRMRVTATQTHARLAHLGGERHFRECTLCDHTDSRTIAPGLD